MSFRIVRTAIERFAKGYLRVAISIATYQKNAIVVMTLREVWIDFDGVRVRVLSLVTSAGARIQRNQIAMSLRELRILLNGLLMLRDGAVDLAGVFQLNALHQVSESAIVERSNCFQQRILGLRVPIRLVFLIGGHVLL